MGHSILKGWKLCGDGYETQTAPGLKLKFHSRLTRPIRFSNAPDSLSLTALLPRLIILVFESVLLPVLLSHILDLENELLSIFACIDCVLIMGLPHQIVG